MAALELQIVDAVVAFLQEHADTLGEPVEIARCYLPRVEHEAADRVRLGVAPRDRQRSKVARRASERNHFIQIGVLQRISRGKFGRDNVDDARVGQLIELVAKIDDQLEHESMAGAAWLSSSTDPLYSAEALEAGIFFAVLTLTYRIAMT